ncbi:MAG: tripartite tricarboxylate transporter permease [Methanomicrobiales archaeon]|nr:tripartite tricarboxylate transporter permease [Methanomicrobiales archaeon]
MLAVLAGTLAGVALGTISGLVPGLHANTLAGILLAFDSVLLPVMGPEILAALLFGALITHSFLDIIPGTFLGVPSADTPLAVLPAHRLCMAGLGQEAVRLSVLGSAMGVAIGVPAAVLALYLMPALQPGIDWGIGILVIGVAGYLIVTSDSPGWSLSIFSLSGILGLFCFRYSYLSWNTLGEGSVLMPLLSGLFGIALLTHAGTGKFPAQRFTGTGISTHQMVRSTLVGSIAGAFVGWLPGLSNATANAVLTPFVGTENRERCFIAATGAANTANALLGLAALYALERARNGVMVAISTQQIPPFGTLLFAGCVAACCAYGIAIAIAGKAGKFNGIDVKNLNIMVIGIITVLSILLCGPFGLLILCLATAIGYVPALLNLHRVSCMGAIMVPLILFSFGLLSW